MMKAVTQIVGYEGNGMNFIWKHPTTDFNSGSQLIVHETQEALFYMNGQALDLFGPGRHILETQNIPLINKFFNKVTGDDTPFHCEVYFIDKTEQMGIKWGLDSKVNYLDPNYNNYPFQIGCSGEMSLRVEDSRKLLIKLVGTVSQMERCTLASYFKAPMMMQIKSFLPSVMAKYAIPVFDIDQHIADFSKDIQELLQEEFADYGVEITKFWITNMVKPEDDPTYRKLRELRGSSMTAVQEAQLQQQIDLIRQQTVAQKIVMESQAIATKRAQEGYTYQQEKAFEVAGEVARNEGIGEFSSAGMGLGMMGGMAGGMGFAVANLTADAMKPLYSTPMENTIDNNSMPPMVNLKQEGSEQFQVDGKLDFSERVKKIKIMYDAGMLTEEEYIAEKNRLMSEI